MSHAAALWLFFLLVAGVVALPGLDMAFVLASALVGGRRAGFAAVAGIVAGGMCHVTFGALGIAVILKVVPSAFNVVLIVGAVYLAWIGYSLARHGLALETVDATAAPRPIWLQAIEMGAIISFTQIAATAP